MKTETLEFNVAFGSRVVWLPTDGFILWFIIWGFDRTVEPDFYTRPVIGTAVGFFIAVLMRIFKRR